MKPGPDLDALVIERVMGYVRYEGDSIPGPPAGTNPRTLRSYRHKDADVQQIVWISSADPLRFLCKTCGNLPHFSTSVEAAWEVEQTIGEMGSEFRNKYVYCLHEIVGRPVRWDSSVEDDWEILRATPEQRCLAALEAINSRAFDAEAKP